MKTKIILILLLNVHTLTFSNPIIKYNSLYFQGKVYTNNLSHPFARIRYLSTEKDYADRNIWKWRGTDNFGNFKILLSDVLNENGKKLIYISDYYGMETEYDLNKITTSEFEVEIKQPTTDKGFYKKIKFEFKNKMIDYEGGNRSKFYSLIYLKKYPNGNKSKKVKKILQTKIYEFLSKIKNYEYTKSYLDIFTEGPNHNEIKSLAENLLYERATNKKGIKDYLAEYPNTEKLNILLLRYTTFQHLNNYGIDYNFREISNLTNNKKAIEVLKGKIIYKYLEKAKTDSNFNKIINIFPNQLTEIDNDYSSKMQVEINKGKDKFILYERYSNLFPNGKLVSEINSFIKTAKSDYAIASQENTIESYQKYIAKYPWGEDYVEAKKREEELAYQIALNENTRVGFKNFLDNYSFGANYENAKSKMTSFPLFKKLNEVSNGLETTIEFKKLPMLKSEFKNNYIFIIESKINGIWKPYFGEYYENFKVVENLMNISKLKFRIKQDSEIRLKVFNYTFDKEQPYLDNTNEKLKSYLNTYFNRLTIKDKVRFDAFIGSIEENFHGYYSFFLNKETRDDIAKEIFVGGRIITYQSSDTEYKEYKYIFKDNKDIAKNWPENLPFQWKDNYHFRSTYGGYLHDTDFENFVKGIKYNFGTNVYYNTYNVPASYKIVYEEHFDLFGPTTYEAVVRKNTSSFDVRTHYTMTVKIKNTSKETHSFLIETFSKVEKAFGEESGNGLENGIAKLLNIARETASEFSDDFEAKSQRVTLKSNESRTIIFKGKCEGVKSAKVRVTPIW